MNDNARKAFYSIEGIISQNKPSEVVGKITLEFLDPALMTNLQSFIHEIDVNFCALECKMASGSDIYAIDYKIAGKRLGKDMKAAAEAFNNGDVSKILPEELKRKTQFDNGLLAYDKTVRITFSDIEGAEDYKLALKFRRDLKAYITEELGLNIVPNIWRNVDEPAERTYILSVILCDCSEKLYQALEKYGKLIFKGVLINFRLATREEIYNQSIKPNIKLGKNKLYLESKNYTDEVAKNLVKQLEEI